MRVQQPEELTKGGIYLPESSKVRPTSGQVVSLGDGRLPNGNQMEFTVKPGDEVRTGGAALCTVWVVMVTGLKGFRGVALTHRKPPLRCQRTLRSYAADRAQRGTGFKCIQYRRSLHSLLKSCSWARSVRPLVSQCQYRQAHSAMSA